MQQQSAATAPANSDLSRPVKTFDLHQRPLMTAMRLVHTEEVASLLRTAIDSPWLPVRIQALAVATGTATVPRLRQCQCLWERHNPIRPRVVVEPGGVDRGGRNASAICSACWRRWDRRLRCTWRRPLKMKMRCHRSGSRCSSKELCRLLSLCSHSAGISPGATSSMRADGDPHAAHNGVATIQPGHAGPARWTSDRLISIGDIRKLFNLGRTAAYELTHRPDFPEPVPISSRCYRWWASEVDAFADSPPPKTLRPVRTSRHPTGDETADIPSGHAAPPDYRKDPYRPHPQGSTVTAPTMPDQAPGRVVHWQAAGRAAPGPPVSIAGESAQFVDPAEIPDSADVARLGQALARGRYRDPGELMANTAAYTRAAPRRAVRPDHRPGRRRCPRHHRGPQGRRGRREAVPGGSQGP
jgi:predicted DNA-binding transcriptional regulator AlpA